MAANPNNENPRNGIRAVLGHADNVIRMIHFNGLNTGLIMGRPQEGIPRDDVNIIVLEPNNNCHVIIPHGSTVRLLNMDTNFEIVQQGIQANNQFANGVVSFDRGIEYYNRNERKTTCDNYIAYLEQMAPITLSNGTLIKPTGSQTTLSIVGNVHAYLV